MSPRAMQLADLPQDVAERIAWRNGEALFAPGK
jgi:hypothetical protein